MHLPVYLLRVPLSPPAPFRPQPCSPQTHTRCSTGTSPPAGPHSEPPDTRVVRTVLKGVQRPFSKHLIVSLQPVEKVPISPHSGKREFWRVCGGGNHGAIDFLRLNDNFVPQFPWKGCPHLITSKSHEMIESELCGV